MVALSALTLALSAASLAAAQSFKITNPSASSWWVAGSQNVLAWDCKSNTLHDTFGVFIANVDQNVFPGDLAIIPQEPNADCSKEITQDQVNQKAGTGYIIKFANPVNSSDVFAQSDPFEIKPLGSAYPSTSPAAGGSTPSGTAGNTAANPSPTNKPNSAVSLKSVGLGFSATIAGAVAYLL